MTGFARTTASHDDLELTCELRAVNHRYLDVQFRLPDDVRALETAMKARIARRLNRGKVDCTVYVRRQTGAIRPAAIDAAVLAGVKSACEAIADSFAHLSPPTALDLLRWPGVVSESEIDADSLGAAVTALLDEALAALDGMRRSEGERLDALLRERLAAIETIAGAVRQRRPAVIAAATQRIQERIESLASDADPARLATEVALLAQKLDVDEELDRLVSHVAEISATLARDEPVGRRLDFLMQELNREANTLGSKSADGETTNQAVELKVLIEQMREQIQNIE